MRKFFVVALATALFLPFLCAQGAVVKKEKSVCPALKSGDMVKISGKATAYTLNADKQVMGFANADALKTWVTAKTKYVYVTQKCFKTLSKPPADEPQKIGFRPGSAVLKVKGDKGNKLFVVEPNNTLAEITPEAAKILYGKKFVAKIISPKDFDNYTNRGADITEAIPHPGMIIKVEKKNYFVDENSVLRELTAKAISANNIAVAMIRALPTQVIENLERGQQLALRAEELARPSQDIRREENNAQEILGENHDVAVPQANVAQPGANIRADAGAAMGAGAGAAGGGAPVANTQPAVNQQPVANPQAPVQENNQNQPVAPPAVQQVAPPPVVEVPVVPVPVVPPVVIPSALILEKTLYSAPTVFMPQTNLKVAEYKLSNTGARTIKLSDLQLSISAAGSLRADQVTEIRMNITNNTTNNRLSGSSINISRSDGIIAFANRDITNNNFRLAGGEIATVEFFADIGKGYLETGFDNSREDTLVANLKINSKDDNNISIATAAVDGQVIPAQSRATMRKIDTTDVLASAPQPNYRVGNYRIKNNMTDAPLILNEAHFVLRHYGAATANKFTNAFIVFTRGGVALTPKYKVSLGVLGEGGEDLLSTQAIPNYSLAAGQEINAEVYLDVADGAGNNDGTTDGIYTRFTLNAGGDGKRFRFEDVFGRRTTFVAYNSLLFPFSYNDIVQYTGIFTPSRSTIISDMTLNSLLMLDFDQDIKLTNVDVYFDLTGAVDLADLSFTSLSFTFPDNMSYGKDFRPVASDVVNRRVEYHTALNPQTLPPLIGDLTLKQSKWINISVISDVAAGGSIADETDDEIHPTVVLSGVGAKDGLSYIFSLPGKTLDFSPQPWQ